MKKNRNGGVQKKSTSRRIEQLLKKPYSRILIPDDDSGTFAAEILEFPGCIAQGDTPDQAYSNLEEAATGWVESALDLGQEIPDPFLNQGFSGKIALRLPRSIHRQAALLAQRDNTSLNQFLLAAISERVGAASLYARMAEKFHQEITFATINMIQTNQMLMIQMPTSIAPQQRATTLATLTALQVIAQIPEETRNNA